MNPKSMSFAAPVLAAAALLVAPGATRAASPESGRAVVAATADRDQNRILVRWQFVEGGKAYAYFDVARRPASGGAFVQLNDDPIGPLSTVAAVQAIFEDPDNADALAWIQADYVPPGDNYATRILQILAEQDEPELTMLPDRNYAAALAMGMGWMDETVAAGQAYVYEVWGLDAQGFRVERLGRASAVAGDPDEPLSPTLLRCVDSGGQPADRMVFLQWSEQGEPRGFGYDVWRAPFDGVACPPDVAGAPGAVRVNAAPVLADAAGEQRLGAKTFQTHCASCHANRDDVKLQGKTADDWRRSVDPDFNPVPGHAAIPEFSPEDLEALFDYIGEFQFGDDADATAGGPLATGSSWCYQALARDLLGQTWALPPGGPAAASAPCQVKDRKRPLPPQPIHADREPTGPDSETCKVTWRRSAESDVTQYRVYRAADAAPKMISTATTPSTPVATVIEPGAGTDAAWTDFAVAAADLGRTFFYAVRAVDASGNLSDFSAWSPCAPRDLAPPAPPTVSVQCCIVPGDCPPAGAPNRECCADMGADGLWNELGGDAVVRSDPRECPVAAVCSGPDVAYCRVFRSFDGEEFLPGPDINAGQPVEIGFDASVDTKMEIELVAYDASGNASGKSAKKKTLLKGKKAIPPPIITKIGFTNTATGEAKIRFRSVAPNALVGVALYRQSVPASDSPPAVDFSAHFLVQLPAGNLASTPYKTSPDIEWVIKPTTKPLSKIALVNSSWIPPAAGDYLVYIEDQKIYEMRTTVGNDPDAVFRLAAIGWTGKQSATKPFRWSGWNMGDLKLDWPVWRTRNAPGTPASAVALHGTVGAGQIDLHWNPWPQVVDPDRPFVVYRRRGSSAFWQQISPAFLATSTGPLTYRDQDVENCFEYDYTVVRQGPDGEFDVQYEIEHVAYSCSPQP